MTVITGVVHSSEQSRGGSYGQLGIRDSFECCSRIHKFVLDLKKT